MKRTISLLFCAILLVSSLAGCKKKDDTPTESNSTSSVSRSESVPNNATESDSTPSDAAVDTSSAESTESNSAPSEPVLTDPVTLSTAWSGLSVSVPSFLAADKQALFAEAYEAVRYLSGLGSYGAAAQEDLSQTIDGNYWYRSDKRFADMAAYQDYLDSLFTPEYQSTLNVMEYYRDIDGHLYAVIGDRGTNMAYQSVQFYEMSQTENEISFAARAYYSEKDILPDSEDWTEDFTFTLVKTSSGWRFSQFSLWF